MQELYWEVLGKSSGIPQEVLGKYSRGPREVLGTASIGDMNNLDLECQCDLLLAFVIIIIKQSFLESR